MSEVPNIYQQFNETDFRRTFVIPYNSGGWVIGNYGEFVVVWLDNKGDSPVYVAENDLAW